MHQYLIIFHINTHANIIILLYHLLHKYTYVILTVYSCPCICVCIIIKVNVHSSSINIADYNHHCVLWMVSFLPLICCWFTGSWPHQQMVLINCIRFASYVSKRRLWQLPLYWYLIISKTAIGNNPDPDKRKLSY